MPRTPKPGATPLFAIRNIPDEVLEAFRARGQRDGWHSAASLVIELMRDYGAGRISPTAAPAPFDPARARPSSPENRG